MFRETKLKNCRFGSTASVQQRQASAIALPGDLFSIVEVRPACDFPTFDMDVQELAVLLRSVLPQNVKDCSHTNVDLEVRILGAQVRLEPLAGPVRLC